MKSLDIHTRQLRYFMELAKCLNFTKAAMHLYIAQPALSQQIADLEKQLGVSLFVRNSRSVSLTAAGKILLEAGPDILARLESVQKQMLQAQAGIRGHLRIGYLDAFTHLLPPLLNSFRQLYPDVSIELFNGTLREQKNALDNGQIDVSFALINYYAMEKENPPTFNVLWQDDMCLIVRKDHPFITSGGTDYSLLANEELLLLDDDAALAYFMLVQDACAEVGFRINKYTTVKTVSAIMMQVDAGLGISMLPRSMVKLAHEHTALLPVKKSYMDFGVVWQHDCVNPTLSLFLDMLEDTIAAVPSE